MKKLFALLKAKTPKIGKRIRNAGAALVGLSVAPEVLPVHSMLPEVPQSWLTLLQMILAFVGLFLTGAGAASTENNPDDID